jgi:hypothetical protein
MIRFLHVVAVGALISSAVYAYTIKYETLYHGEQLQKLKTRIVKEREGIAVLQAEWQHLNRPEMLQMLTARHLDTQQMTINQLVRFSDVPARAAQRDDIGDKLAALGLGADAAPTASVNPRPGASAPARPATARPPVARGATPALVTPRPQTAAAPPRAGSVRANLAAPTSQRAAPAAAPPTTSRPPARPAAGCRHWCSFRI